MIARTARRIEALCPPDRAFIATGTSLVGVTREALPWFPESAFLAEPVARNDQDAQAVLADAAASKSAKATAQTRSTAARAASGALDTEVDQAKRAVEEMDARSSKLEKDYNAALDALEKALNNLPKKT